APPAVTLAGPASLFTGETQTYTIDIVTAASTTAVGFDVAASDGTLGTVTQTNASQLLAGEVTHTSALAKGKEVRLMFTLTAPAAPGTVTLFAAGLASNGHDDTAGDSSAASTLTVTVGPPPANADLAGVDAVSGATSKPPVAGDEPRWACSFGASASA